MLIILLIYIANNAPKIKRIKRIPFQKENQSSAFLKSGGCNREKLLKMTSQIDMLHSSVEKNDQLYVVAVVEAKYLFSWLFQNNLPGVENRRFFACLEL